jgi:hypothetical protein
MISINPHYDNLCKSISPYAATLIMAQTARSIADSLDNRISISVALDHAAKGTIPNPRNYPDHRLDRIKDYISYIEDNNLKVAIVQSYKQSLKANYLIYDYINIEDEPTRSRLRIVMNILWDTRPYKL